MTRSVYPTRISKGKFMPGVKSDCIKPGRMKRLATRAHDDPEALAQRELQRMEAVNAKSFRRLKSRQLKAPDYAAAIADFTETEDCTPVDSLALNPRCIEIARQFNKAPQEVAHDINHTYLDSYNPYEICARSSPG